MPRMTAMLRRLLGKAGRDAPRALPAVAPDERVYAVGDVHGRNDLLQAMIRRLEADHAGFDDGRRARVIFLGDYVDRGDHARDVLETLSGLTSTFSLPVTCLMGNHEAALLRFLDDPLAMARWLEWGGRQTLASYGIPTGSKTPEAARLHDLRAAFAERIAPHLPFLQGLARYATSGEVIFAHAGLDPARPLEAQEDEVLLWGRSPTGRVETLPGHRLVHGHFDRYDPITTPARICVDTGAYYSGRLSAVRLDGTEAFLHVDEADRSA